MLACFGADWRPTIGDPTVFGWITVLSYLTCAILAVVVWNSRREPVLRRFWAVTTLILAFLAFNKQLDLQTAMTQTLRCMSLDQGWYNVRQFAQVIFVVVMIAVVFLLYWRGMQAMRRYRRSHRMAMIGLGFVAAFVLIRASSFHWIDVLGSLHVAGASTNFLLENVGLVLIALNAIGLLTGRIRVPARPARGPFTGTAPQLSPARAGQPEPSEPDHMAAPRFPVGPINH